MKFGTLGFGIRRGTLLLILSGAIGLQPVSIARGEKAEKLTVYTVNYPLKYFAERIAGVHATVVFPAPAGGDPAYWLPDGKTISNYQQADLILLNGARYAKWIDMYSSPEFAEVAEWCRELVDEAAADLPAETLRRMEDAFLTSSRYELLFWEMAWRQEHWPA